MGTWDLWSVQLKLGKILLVLGSGNWERHEDVERFDERKEQTEIDDIQIIFCRMIE